MRYYKINGVIEISDNNDLDMVTDFILNNLHNYGALGGGSIKEVDYDGDDLKEKSEEFINNQKTK